MKKNKKKLKKDELSSTAGGTSTGCTALAPNMVPIGGNQNSDPSTGFDLTSKDPNYYPPT